MTDPVRLSYRLLTGPDDATFCERVTQALREGYELYGSPATTFNGDRVIAAQAVILRDARTARDWTYGIRYRTSPRAVQDLPPSGTGPPLERYRTSRRAVQDLP